LFARFSGWPGKIKSIYDLCSCGKQVTPTEIITLRALMKIGLNLVGPQVRKWRDNRGWSQETMACKLQLLGWSISRHSLAKLELGLRRVSDCELFFLARTLRLDLRDLFPRQVPLKVIGPVFQSGKKGGKRNALFPTRGDK
jgi:DNA-binding XRE family transcriptional regulator